MLQGIITGLLISVAFYFMTRNSNKKPIINYDGTIEYKAGKLVFYFGLIPVLISFAALVISIYLFIQNKEGTAEWPLLFIFLLFFGLGIPNLLSGLFYKIVTDTNSIKQRTIFNKWKEVRWEDINSIKYFSMNRDLILKGSNIKIRCNEFLVGFPLLAHEIASKTNRDITDLDLPDQWLKKNENWVKENMVSVKRFI